MKMRYIMPVFMLISTLAACDDYNDQFHFLEENGIKDEKKLQIALSGSDYVTIADLEANQAIAMVKEDQGGGNYVEALANVKTNKYFTIDAPAAEYIPAWLEMRYPEATDGSRIKVSYNEYRTPSSYLDELNDIKAYTLKEEDYKTVWGEGKKALYLSPNSLSKLDAVLKNAMPNATDGAKVLVNYAYDDVEPSFTESEDIVAYVPVNEIAEEGGRYVIAAAYEGNYYAFGNTSSWSSNYGYFYPKNPLVLTDGKINLADGEVEELVVEKGTTGFTLKDYSGYYLYMTGNYNNFNRTTSVPTAGGEWSFVSNGDGTVALKNIEKDKTVKLTLYNSSLSYGAYSEDTYQGNVYFEDDCSSLETTKFSINDVLLPTGSTYVWKVDENYKYWKASSFVGGANKESESYIVSSEIDLTNASAPVLTWKEVINHIKAEQTVDDLAVCVSTDYAGDVSAATWVKLTVTDRPSGKDWNEANPIVDLSAYKGKKIFVGFQYVSTTSSASTWEIWDVAVKDQTNYWDVCLFKGMSQSEISETPSTSGLLKEVRAAGDVQSNKSVVYVYDSGNNVWEVYKPEGTTIVAVDANTYNQIGADYLMRPDTQIPVFLAQNYPYVTNGALIGVVYTNVKGKIVVDEYKYSSGLWKKSTTVSTKKLNFTLQNGKWVAGANSYYENTLLGDEGGFTACNVYLSNSMTSIWKIDNIYGWKGSAYQNSKQNPAEAWLVSPAIFLEESEAPIVTFEEAANKMGDGKVDAMFTVWVTKDADKYNEENPDVSACTWTQLTLDTRASGNNWDFVNVGQIDLSEYNGETIRIAMKYTSTEGGAGTWEIKNFSVAERSE